MSPAAISVSENILHGISVYRSNPTRFYVHVFPLFQGYLRPYARLDGKQLFHDPPPENISLFLDAAATHQGRWRLVTRLLVLPLIASHWYDPSRYCH